MESNNQQNTEEALSAEARESAAQFRETMNPIIRNIQVGALLGVSIETMLTEVGRDLPADLPVSVLDFISGVVVGAYGPLPVNAPIMQTFPMRPFPVGWLN